MHQNPQSTATKGCIPPQKDQSVEQQPVQYLYLVLFIGTYFDGPGTFFFLEKKGTKAPRKSLETPEKPTLQHPSTPVVL